MKSDVTWCTARTSGSNLFYSYNGIDKYLVYIIKDSPRPHPDPAGVWDYISIGVKNGKIQTPTGGAGSTVERDNNENTRRDSFFEDMKSATSPYYDQIMAVVNSIADKRSDSPSVEYQLKSLTDPKLITHVLGSLGFREKINEINSLMEMARAKGAVISPEVRATIVKLLKIEQSDGSYNYDKFDGVHQVIRVLSQVDPNHFKSVDNLKNILEKSAQQNNIYISRDQGLMAELLTKTMEGSTIRGNLGVKRMARKLAMLQGVKEEISSNTSVFGPEGTRFLLDVIKKARGSFQKFADLITDVKKARSVEEARLAYKKGSSVVPSKSALDDVFIAHLNHQFLPTEIIDRNITDYRIKDNLLSLADVERLLREASTSKQSALSFLRKFKKLSDVALVTTQSTESAKLYRRAMLLSFDLMTSREIFEVIERTSDQIADSYSEEFESSVRALKSDQPEKFREVAEKVKNMVFPPKIISNAFSVETESMSDFVDNLFGDADDSIDDLLADLGVDDIQF
jgi:hypothetical protein